MVEDVTNELIYEVLKKVQDGQAKMSNDMHDFRFRITQMERTQGLHTSHFSHLTEQMDTIKEPLDRIEKRLDLVEA